MAPDGAIRRGLFTHLTKPAWYVILHLEPACNICGLLLQFEVMQAGFDHCERHRVYKVDYGDFNKFIVSLGMACIALAVLGPWLFLRELGSWLVERSNEAELSKRACELLSARYDIARFVLLVFPWFSAIMGAVGLSLVVWGLVRWRTKQGVIDQESVLKNTKLEREVERMTETQIEHKAQEEIRDLIAENAIPDRPAQVEPELTVSAEDGLGQRHEPVSVHSYRQTEQAVADILRSLFSKTHLIRTNVHVGTAEFDVLIEAPRSTGPDFLVETKFSPRGFKHLAVSAAALQLMANCVIYTKSTGRHAKPVLLLVVPDDLMSTGLGSRQSQRVLEQARALGLDLAVHFLPLERLQELDSLELMRIFLD